MLHKNILYLSTTLLVIFQLVTAQLGPPILSPVQNATVPVGGNVDIVYQYQNMGTGNYSIDIQLWQDGAITELISNVTTNHEIKPGNSSGVKVMFTMNDTYTWKVPHGLNSTFWLTVTANSQTKFYPKGLAVRSRPVMLHPSAASLSRPSSIALLLVMSFIAIVAMFS
ncbi:unnamed protein product [Mucor hiemalis]